MKDFVYPAGLILIPLGHTTYVQAPKLAAIQKTLNAHTETLNAHIQTLEEHSRKLNILAESFKAAEVRQKKLEKAQLALEQRIAERRTLGRKMQEGS